MQFNSVLKSTTTLTPSQRILKESILSGPPVAGAAIAVGTGNALWAALGAAASYSIFMHYNYELHRHEGLHNYLQSTVRRFTELAAPVIGWMTADIPGLAVGMMASWMLARGDLTLERNSSKATDLFRDFSTSRDDKPRAYRWWRRAAATTLVVGGGAVGAPNHLMAEGMAIGLLTYTGITCMQKYLDMFHAPIRPDKNNKDKDAASSPGL